MWRRLVLALAGVIVLTGCGTMLTPEQLAEKRIEKLQEDCEILKGDMLGDPMGPTEIPYRIRVVIFSDTRVVWAVARNREKHELLEWLKQALIAAQALDKGRVKVCGAWITDEYFEMVKAYDFEFTSIRFWMPDAGPAGGRYVTMRTNYGDRLKDEIKENWWDIIKGFVKRLGGVAKKAAL